MSHGHMTWMSGERTWRESAPISAEHAWLITSARAAEQKATRPPPRHDQKFFPFSFFYAIKKGTQVCMAESFIIGARARPTTTDESAQERYGAGVK